MLMLKIDTEKVNPLFINLNALSNLVSILEYRIDDARIQLDTIRNALSNLKLNTALKLTEQKQPDGTLLYNTDAKLNTALQLTLLKSDDNISLLKEYFKMSKILAQRIKKCSTTCNERDLYENIIKEYFLDKEQKNLLIKPQEV